MRNRSWVWVIFGGLATSAGMLGVACSSSDTTTTGGTHSGADSGGSDAQGVDDTGTTGDSGGGGGDAGADCGKAAVLHPPKADGGIFCPFSGVDGGKDLYCPDTDQCCESGKGGGPSTCVPKGTPCPSGATTWQCEDPANCSGGQKCCAHSGDAGAVTVMQDSCGPYLSKFSGTTCQASCGTGELVVCEATAECGGGSCTPLKTKGNEIGICQ